MILPTFLGIGVPRGGTTWLHEWLSGHAEVCMPTRRKEVRFFDRHYERGLGWYAAYFCPPEERGRYLAVGEISPQYLYDEECAARIAADLPDVKLLLMLRHPVDRAYSNYGFVVQRKNYRRPFSEFVASRPDMLEKGFYSRYVKRYLRHFDRERILPLVFERTFADMPATERRVADFLGISPEKFAQNGAARKVNRSTVPSAGAVSGLAVKTGRRLRRLHLEPLVDLGRRMGVQRLIARGAALPKLDPETRRELGRRYEHDFDELERCLEIDLSCWRP